MNRKEANEIIAEYMNSKITMAIALNKAYSLPNYESLDALVYVWEKLDKDGKKIGIQLFLDGDRVHRFQIWDNDYECLSTHDFAIKEYVIQEAACIATAKAILALKGGE